MQAALDIPTIVFNFAFIYFMSFSFPILCLLLYFFYFFSVVLCFVRFWLYYWFLALYIFEFDGRVSMFDILKQFCYLAKCFVNTC